MAFLFLCHSQREAVGSGGDKCALLEMGLDDMSSKSLNLKAGPSLSPYELAFKGPVFRRR
jgi:hypothetical protein